VLDKSIADDIFGDSLSCSATRLGGFAACPYKHFTQYILKLKERKIFSFEPIDLGSFYHRLLDELFKRLKKQNKNFKTATDDELIYALHEQIATILKDDLFLSNFIKRSRHNAYIIESAVNVLEDCIGDIAQSSRAGAFTQTASELWFGDSTAQPCELITADGKKIILRGIIDRVDCAEIDGKCVAVVFDYKRGSKSFSWSKFYHGLDMQLPIYMLGLAGTEQAGRKIDCVGGAFFVPIEAGLEKISIDNLPQQQDKFKRKAKGIFNGGFFGALDQTAESQWSRFYHFYMVKDEPYGYFGTSSALHPEQFEKVLSFAKSRITELAANIFSGSIDITPYRMNAESACTYCRYRAVCRFDWQINDYNFLDSISKTQILVQIGAAHGS
jgi:ATP-dependent helicase/nuclease subunit B